MEDISLSEFKNAFRYQKISFSNKKLRKSVEISTPRYRNDSLELLRVTFEEITFAENFIATNTISNCVGSKLKFEGLRGDSLAIKNSTISIVELTNCTIGDIVISDSSVHTLRVVDSNIHRFELSQLDSVQDLYIKTAGKTGETLIRSVVAAGACPPFLIDSEHAVSIHEVKCTTLNVSRCRSLHINKLITDECSLDVDVATTVALADCCINATLSAKTKSAQTFSVTGCSIEKLLSGLGRTNNFKDCSFGTIELVGRTSLKRTILFTQCRIKSLVVPGLQEYEALSLYEIIVSESLNLENGVLKANLNRVDLSTCDLKIINTKILIDCEFVNIQWPKNHSLYEYTKELKAKSAREKLSYLLALKEAYRQLKVVSIDRHNKIDAMLFQKHEIKIHCEIISICTWNLGSRSRWRNLGDYLILKTNSLFSDFGLSWTRPLFWWITFHFFLFWLLIENFDLGIRVQMDHDWQAFYEGLKLYLKLLFPIHDFEIASAYNEKKVAIWGVIDFAMRISSSYFLYYFIRGTRKFNLS